MTAPAPDKLIEEGEKLIAEATKGPYTARGSMIEAAGRYLAEAADGGLLLSLSSPNGPEQRDRDVAWIVWLLSNAPALLALARQNCWQDIKSAPKDGTEVLAVAHGAHHVVSWDAHAWGDDDSAPGMWTDTVGYIVEGVTKWMPLPAAPADQQESETNGR